MPASLQSEQLGFQDANFVVSRAVGCTVLSIVCFEDDEGNAEKVLVQLSDVGWAHFYLDAGLGFWSFIDSGQVAELYADYEGLACQNIGSRHELIGVKLLGATCVTDHNGVSIALRTESGSLKLTGRAPGGEPAADSLDWTPG